MRPTDLLPVTTRATRVISPRAHAVLDYGVAATFLTMGFRLLSRHRRAAALAFINGGLVLGVSLLTDYPGGIWRKIPFRTHGMIDVGQAALAGFGPLLFGFAHNPDAQLFYSQATSEIGVVAATDWERPSGA
jgi:hypothetical protein